MSSLMTYIAFWISERSLSLKRTRTFSLSHFHMNISPFTFISRQAIWNVFTHDIYSILNFRKIFVAEENSYIFFVPFSYEHFTFHVYFTPSLKCRLVRFDFVNTNRANKNYHTWQRSLAVHFISSFINHKWDLVCYSFSNSIAPNITSV